MVYGIKRLEEVRGSLKPRKKQPLNLIEVASGRNNNDRLYHKRQGGIVSFRVVNNNTSENTYRSGSVENSTREIIIM